MAVVARGAHQIGGGVVTADAGGEPLVYNLAEDYYEKKDLAAERPAERRLLTDALSTFLVYQSGWRKADFGLANNMTAKAADELDK